MIQQSCIEQVKAAANVVEVVEKYIKLKQEGVNLVACCPFHNEKSGSFKVSKSKNIYKCFGCGVSGDAIDFVMKYDNKNYIEAIEVIAGMYNIHLAKEDEAPSKRNYVRPAFKDLGLSIDVVDFFKGRYINEQTLKSLKVTQVAEWMPKAKDVVMAICFNYFRDNELVNIKYRSVAEKDFKLAKDAELIFYNLDSITKAEKIVIVEGEMDCLSVHQSGHHAVISVPNGASKSVQRLEYLENCWDRFSHVKKIVLMLDNDAPGISLRDEIARRFGFDKCLKVVYPTGCKDANDILVRYGAPHVLDAINYAVEFPIEGVFSMDDLYQDVKTFFGSGYPSGYSAGVDELDEHIQFMLGQITTWTGIPGSGKSEFVDYIMTQLAKVHGWNFGVCSFENQPSSLHVTKLMEKYAGKSFINRSGPVAKMNESEFKTAIEFVSNHFYFININKVDVTLQGILDKAKELVLRRGIKGLLIDPWNYIEHKIEKGQTETQYTSECLTKIKAFALTHNIHIFFIAHPAKMGKSNGKYEIPTLYHISGSAHFFNKTDNGITVYRDFETGVVDIYIQKVRYSWLGKVGRVSFNFDLNTRQYSPVNGRPVEVKAPEPPDDPTKGFQKPSQRIPETFWNKD